MQELELEQEQEREKAEVESKPQPLFELNPERIETSLAITKRGVSRKVTHVIRRPSDEDWIRYDRGLNVAVRDVKLEGK